MNHSNRILLAGIIFIIASILLFPFSLYAGQYKIIRVVDGDTIVVDYKGKAEKVRLLCVNTPESVHSDQKQNVPMGIVASNYAKKRLSGKYVDLEFEGRKRGNYGRLLAYVFVAGDNFCIDLVRQGLSPYYTKYGHSQRYHKAFRKAEKYARNNNLNIWGNPGLTDKYLRLKSKWGQPRTPTQTTKPVVGHKYLASKKSKVFHRPVCKWANKISSHNLIVFDSKKDALNSGRRECKVCKP